MNLRIKKIIGHLLPPCALALYKGYLSPYGFSGRYNSWAEAREKTSGYTQESILNKVREAMKKVATGQAVHERDSVTFDKIEYSWPLLAGLLKTALDNQGELRVIDYGGSLGTSYFQNRLFLAGLEKLLWGIVEQENFVRVGREMFSDNHLKFYQTLEEGIAEVQPNVIILSSVMQYLPEPSALWDKILSYDIQYIIIDRTPLLAKESRIVIQKVNPEIYAASYPAWLINESELISHFSAKYDLMADFESNDGRWYLKNLPIDYKGFIFKHK